MLWFDQTDLADVVMVSDEDIPERTAMFALVYVPDSECLTWEELIDAAIRENRNAAAQLAWSVEDANRSHC